MNFQVAYIFDLDGTLIKNNISASFYFYALRKGIFSIRSLPLFFKEALRFFFTADVAKLNANIFSSLIKGMRLDLLVDAGEAFAARISKNKRYAPAFKKFEDAKKVNAFTVILSSSPEFLVSPLAKRWGCVGIGSTYLIDASGYCKDVGVCLTGEEKALQVLNMKQANMFKKIICFSNGFSDLPFLYVGDEAIVVRPDRKLKKIATKEGWSNI